MNDSPVNFMDPEISPQAYAQLRSASGQKPAPGTLDLSSVPETPVLLDVREPWEAQRASLPGAVLMPMGEVPSRAHAELDPDHHIVVLCHHGQRSLSVAMWLRAQGFDYAQSLAGGIDEWSRNVDPSIPRY